MLFAVIDYLNYRRQKGRFSFKNEKDPMTYAFKSNLPESVVNKLKPADVILLGSYDWLVSWAIMYLTSSQISHLALYIGNREILHETLSGSVKEPIEAIYGPNTRLIIGQFPQNDSQKISLDGIISKYTGIRYAIEDVVIKGLRIISGRDWPYFRWKFFFDISILIFFLDVPIIMLLGFPIFSFIILFHLLLIIINSMLWRKDPLSPFAKDVGKPCDMLRWLIFSGGKIILDTETGDDTVKK